MAVELARDGAVTLFTARRAVAIAATRPAHPVPGAEGRIVIAAARGREQHEPEEQGARRGVTTQGDHGQPHDCIRPARARET